MIVSIVVGAGPAGTACAYELAKAGVNVLLLERGEYPGSKNVMGGVLYRKMMEGIIPEFYKEAPLERPIVEQRFMLMDKESAVTFSYKGLEWGASRTTTLPFCGRSLTNGLPRKQSNKGRCSFVKRWHSNASLKKAASSVSAPTARTARCMPMSSCWRTA
nr:FAD-dependent oxidoreductase [Geobacillus sp. CAMR5420]